MLYAINATLSRRTADGWTTVRQVPTFYLNSRTQGIVSARHAEDIARDILGTASVSSTDDMWTITAFAV